MGWLEGLTRNRAELDEAASDPLLRPLVIPLPPGVALAQAADRIAQMRRWKVVEANATTLRLHATHATRVWRFIDDVHLRFEPAPAGTRISGRSKARIGAADFGQNKRNLRELHRSLQTLGQDATRG
jgi:uncharacterized protein (DUF1499 family)